ncbi:MAG: Acetyl-coenzyme A carboxylase carboxyl transferase subunit beta [candidate division WS2 bacterium]|nr:Acetyl-coenzyme A carboxylase carboxyl transferase subunit beta [Candidatus Lithacetigena glycinireducens]MBT9174812.1 Acetyl-coenzyme A carboxylase carboxyl transferase subunit beta [Candidatus Lithacetigena glycinireducens]
MNLLNRLNWLRKPKVKTGITDYTSTVPDNIWIKCESCQTLIYNNDLIENLKVCPHCNHHHRLTAREQISQICDPGTFYEEDASLSSRDTLGFKDTQSYVVKLKEAKKKTGLSEAVITGIGQIGSYRVGMAVMDFNFLGGSMGSVMGEKLVRIIYKAIKEELPLIIICASGGARMQEGILSLFQMAKINYALNEFSSKSLLFISVLTNPTTGGVTASFAYAADIVLAEEGALIGFAGPRVIEQTTKLKLPEGFQRANFLLDKGMVDRVVNRKSLKSTLISILEFNYGR